MKRIAFIPARCGSKSISFKNIKDFCGKPLIYWNLNELQKSTSIDEIIVATDCKEIEETVCDLKFSKVQVYERKKENAADTSSTESAMLEYLQTRNLKSEDLILLVQITSPFTKAIHFDEAISQYLDGKFDSMLTCTPFKRFMWNQNGQPINYDYANRPRRQDFEETYLENGAFYISTYQNIISHKNRLNGKIGIYEMPEFTSYELDEEDDWIIAEAIMKNKMIKESKINIDFGKIRLFASDVDGVLTDAGMYYTENGDEIKKFNTRDGMGFELLRNAGIKTALITSENTKIVEKRAAKLRVDYLRQGKKYGGKYEALKEICDQEKIDLSQVAYIGDDLNCAELLNNIGFPACPSDANEKIKSITNIRILERRGGEGVVREFADMILRK